MFDCLLEKLFSQTIPKHDLVVIFVTKTTGFSDHNEEINFNLNPDLFLYLTLSFLCPNQARPYLL